MSTSSVTIIGVDGTDTTLTLTGSNVSIGTATISGTNTGDQTTVSGNAGTATALQNARNIGGVSFNGTSDIVPNTTTVANDTTNSSYYITFVSSATGAVQELTNASIRVNPSTATISATTFVGALTGNVTGNVSGSSGSCTGNSATVTTNANLTGDVTSSGNATTLAAASITGRTEDTTPDSGADYILTYDASATALKKVLIQNLPAATSSPPYGLNYVLAIQQFTV